MDEVFDKGSIRAKLHATDWLADPVYAGGKQDIVQVQFKNTRMGFYRVPAGLELHIGDLVAVESNPGHDIGKVMMTGPLVRLQMKKNGVADDEQLKQVFRLARPADIEKFQEAKEREHATMIRSRQIAAELGLDMKIGDVEYQGDGGKAIFYYIADERVDFRKLIRILADTFHIRIEMRQIGARQEAGRIGGIGPCGRPLCCSSWMGKFVSVGTGAARLQDLSMNPQKLAGQCAKLKCCINFETDTYMEAAKQLPPKDVPLETLDNTYYYFKPDILALKVTYSTDKHIPANLVTISAERALEVIRLNKEGEKPESLQEDEESADESREYIDLTDQDSLTRFDQSKKKKKKNKGKAQNQNQKQGQKPKQKQERKQNQGGEKQGEQKRQPQPRKQRENGQQPRQQKGQKRQRDNRGQGPKNGRPSQNDKPAQNENK